MECIKQKTLRFLQTLTSQKSQRKKIMPQTGIEPFFLISNTDRKGLWRLHHGCGVQKVFKRLLHTNWNWTKSLRDGLPRLWHSDFLFSITKQWKASPKSSIVKSPQRNNQTGSTFPLPMKRIPPFRLVGKRFYDPNAPPYKAVFRITTDFIWRILLCMKNI